MGCNPIYIKDVDGRDLKIGGDQSYALNDVQSLVPKKYRSLVSASKDGMIEFQFNKLPEKVQKFKGATLLNNMINSKNHFLYIAGDQIDGVRDRSTKVAENTYTTPKMNIESLGYVVDNFSITDPKSTAAEQRLPPDGFQGAVRISEGEFSLLGTQSLITCDIPREHVIFHEFDENYLRTENSLGYDDAHHQAGKDTKTFHKENLTDNFGVSGNLSGGTFKPTGPATPAPNANPAPQPPLQTPNQKDSK
jgi:hypothetical protein